MVLQSAYLVQISFWYPWGGHIAGSNLHRQELIYSSCSNISEPQEFKKTLLKKENYLCDYNDGHIGIFCIAYYIGSKEEVTMNDFVTACKDIDSKKHFDKKKCIGF